MPNKDLHQAKVGKNDEFYTQLTDIEKELSYYTDFFQGKTVLCNCDDPRVSNFFHYFAYNFEYLGLKRLITTCYKNQDSDLFSSNSSDRAIWLEYTGDKNGNKVPDPEEIGINYFEGNGDFRSEECLELLQQADVVVTNPPFSLFREYISQLVKYDKKFIVIGNINAVTYKEIFPLIMHDKLWLGASIHSGDREFGVPDYYPLEAAGCRIDEEGNKFIRVKGVRWFTNVEHSKRNEELVLYQKYKPENYPTFDNYNAINVDKTADIPCDYFDMIGVPVTFLDHYNPNQFEILGITQRNDDPYKIKKYTKADYPNANDLNARGVLIIDGKPKSIYARILIRRRETK